VVGKTVCNERRRYTEWDGGRRGVEFYDHDTDPDEYYNLADDPQHATIAAERKRLLPP